MLKSENLGKHFRIMADSRDLNYDKYFSEGESKLSLQNEYNSSNTDILTKEELIKVLLKLDVVKSELK